MKPLQSFPDLSPKVVLGVGAHPDDIDFSAAGTLANFVQQGAAVHYLQITDGCKGSHDQSATNQTVTKQREAEQQAACQVIGGSSVRFLHYCDGELEVSLKLKADIVAVIRELCPDVVITLDPAELYAPTSGMISHSDHRAAGQATLDAVYPLARDHLSFPEQLQKGLEPHKVSTVLLANFENHNYYVDISEQLNTKLAAVQAHASQLDDLAAAKRQFTEIAERAGKQSGFRYAEGFMRIDLAI